MELADTLLLRLELVESICSGGTRIITKMRMMKLLSIPLQTFDNNLLWRATGPPPVLSTYSLLGNHGGSVLFSVVFKCSTFSALLQ